MGVTFVGIIAALLFLTSGGQSLKNPELSEGFTPAQHEAYTPKAGPDCDADKFSARSDCSR